MLTKEEQNVIVISSFKELTYRAKRALLSNLTCPEPDFDNCEKLLIKMLSTGVYNKVREQYESPTYRKSVIEELEQKGIECVTYFSDSYPDTLKQIDSAPVMLYCRGDVSLLKSNCFSVVGSRNTLPTAYEQCKRISGELTKYFTVVTGIAEGADTAAAEGALNAGGKAIFVVANGLDRIYPPSNENIIRRNQKEGLIITEYQPDEKPQRFYFPVRNRIIAGLSRGTLVVSAKQKGGALITANYASEYGRDVFAFPYSNGIISGEGCNALIKKGACLTRNILDIFAEYGLDFNTPDSKPLTGDEALVYEAVRERGVAFLPEIAALLNRQPYELVPVMISLEMEGLVANLGGNRYGVIK